MAQVFIWDWANTLKPLFWLSEAQQDHEAGYSWRAEDKWAEGRSACCMALNFKRVDARREGMQIAWLDAQRREDKPMKKPATALHISLQRARRHWYSRQGLAAPGGAPLEEIVSQSGWLRTLGGGDVYLAMRARALGMKRSGLDQAVEARRLQVIPAVRGCIYLVPRPFVALSLKVAEEQSRKRTESEHEKVGISKKELVDAGEAIIGALKKTPLSTDGLRKALPKGAVRSLGELGKKVGISSTLPPALRLLEFDGRIERISENGRLDTERYVWRIPDKNLFEEYPVPGDAVERYVQIANEFFKHAGPATLEDFCDWGSLLKRDAKAVIAKAGLIPISVEGYAEEAFVRAEDEASLKQDAGHSDGIHFLSFEDNYIVLHGGPRWVSDVRHHDRAVHVWGQTRGVTLGTVKHMATRSIFEGDSLIGFWEYDVDAGDVVWATFDHIGDKKKKKMISTAASEIGAFIRDEIGHARSYSLDNEEAIRKRAALVRAVG